MELTINDQMFAFFSIRFLLGLGGFPGNQQHRFFKIM